MSDSNGMHRLDVKWQGLFKDSIDSKPVGYNGSPVTDRALSDTAYYECAYMCPACDETKRFARKPLYPILFKIKTEPIMTKFNDTDCVIFNLFTCPKCHRFFASLKQFGTLDLRDEQLMKPGNYIYPALRELALISEPYGYDEWKALVSKTNGLAIM